MLLTLSMFLPSINGGAAIILATILTAREARKAYNEQLMYLIQRIQIVIWPVLHTVILKVIESAFEQILISPILSTQPSTIQ